MMPQDSNKVRWFMDRWCYFRGRLYADGWFFHVEKRPLVALDCTVSAADSVRPVTSLAYSDIGLPSPDVAGQFGRAARDCRFRLAADVESIQLAATFAINLRFEDVTVTIRDPGTVTLTTDPYHLLRRKFFTMLRKKPGATVVEIGSRARSGNIAREMEGSGMHYVGVDIMPGQNVDVVCDAHRLSTVIEANSVDAIFSVSVFEHLLMPWKVAIEINRVLKPGGLVLVMTHQSFPMHDTPWDYWRYSDQAWTALFNRHTGFEIVETALGEPTAMVANILTPVTQGFEGAPSYIGSAVICRKTDDTKLDWQVDVADIVPSLYPA